MVASVQSLAIAVTCFMLLTGTAWANYTLTSAQQKILDAWLAGHPTYRVATDADCQCAMNIQDMRTGAGDSSSAVPDYHPYRARGDFNGDGVEDFAVVLLDRSKETADERAAIHEFAFALLVFDGPPTANRHPQPALFRPGLQLKRAGLFLHDRGRAKLGVGEFEKDDVMVEPQARTYSLDLPLELGISHAVGVLDVLVRSRLAASESDAKRLIHEGSVRFNDEVVSSEKTLINQTGWLEVGQGRRSKTVFIEKDR
jgi:hypothetical protein